jgi:hypothetical protein
MHSHRDLSSKQIGFYWWLVISKMNKDSHNDMFVEQAMSFLKIESWTLEVNEPSHLHCQLAVENESVKIA